MTLRIAWALIRSWMWRAAGYSSVSPLHSGNPAPPFPRLQQPLRFSSGPSCSSQQ
jgi:hypothetical protein